MERIYIYIYIYIYFYIYIYAHYTTNRQFVFLLIYGWEIWKKTIAFEVAYMQIEFITEAWMIVRILQFLDIEHDPL